jgi:hypothetical protein
MSQEDMLKLQRIQSLNKKDEKLKEMVHPPEVAKFTQLLNNLK